MLEVSVVLMALAGTISYRTIFSLRWYSKWRYASGPHTSLHSLLEILLTDNYAI